MEEWLKDRMTLNRLIFTLEDVGRGGRAMGLVPTRVWSAARDQGHDALYELDLSPDASFDQQPSGLGAKRGQWFHG